MDGTALIFCEGALGTPDARTANNLLRFSERYQIVGVIDSACAGRDASEVIEGARGKAPVFASLDDALSGLGETPKKFVVGLTPEDGKLPPHHRAVIIEAIRRRMGVDSALRPFLHEDAEFPGLAMQYRAELRSVGRPAPLSNLRRYTGEIERVGAARVAVVGTGRPTGGKNVTAVRLAEELNRGGVRAAMIGTSEAAWFQGVRHTVLLDSVLHGSAPGELERVIVEAERDLRPRVMVLEGAGSLLDRAQPIGLELLTTARPSCVILQHAPALTDDADHGAAAVERHVKAVEAVAGCPVVGIALSHVGFSAGLKACRDEAELCGRAAPRLEAASELPVVDVLAGGAGRLAEIVRGRLPRARAA